MSKVHWEADTTAWKQLIIQLQRIADALEKQNKLEAENKALKKCNDDWAKQVDDNARLALEEMRKHKALRYMLEALVEDGSDYDDRFIAVDTWLFNKAKELLQEQGNG